MGCGHSKINFYPRRSKNSRKENGAKKAGSDNEEEEEEEEESTPEESPEEIEEQPDTRQHVLPIAEHQPSFEVSASQQNFFKMLDDKIEQGKDFDSSSETEIQSEQEYRRMIIERWQSFTQSQQAAGHQSIPPAQAKRRLTRSVAKASERHGSPSTTAQCYRRESPPIRRAHSAAQTQEPLPSTSSDWETTKTPIKRSQSAGTNWKSNSKVAPFPKPKERKDDAVPGCSKDSQITYNPTFQNHSPAHSKSQPYIAQISSYPLSQQVAPPSPSKYIAPPAEYQDPSSSDRNVTVAQVNTQSQIYYIQGNNTTPDIVQQRQQTAIHLQQFVAMKQAQQQMFMSYMQRGPRALLPNDDYLNNPRMDEGVELAAQYGHPGLRPQSAPHRPGLGIQDVTHSHVPMWSPLPPVMTTPWVDGQVPPEMQYYPQSQFVPMFRANSAGSAGTLTRYHKKDDSEKSVSISVVRGKPVGQIVNVGGQELAVSSTVSDSPSPASLSTDSGVSPGTSAPSSKSSFSTTPPTTRANDTFDPKPKKTKVAPATRALKSSKSLDA